MTDEIDITDDNLENKGPRFTGPNGQEGEQKPRKMTRAEAGRKGGLSTKRRYGDQHFSEIGRLGGKKGGESTKQRYGVEFYQEIGRKGGAH